MNPIKGMLVAALVWFAILEGKGAPPKIDGVPASPSGSLNFNALRFAIMDLMATHGPRYSHGAGFFDRLERLEHAAEMPAAEQQRQFHALQREALLANPLLDFDRVLVVRRKLPPAKNPLSREAMMALGFPSNHECNSSLDRSGFDNELAVLSLQAARADTASAPARPLPVFYRPPTGSYVGEVDLHWDADRLLFTQSSLTNWTVCEMHADGSSLRQVSHMPDDVDAFDACYLPNGRIVFGATSSFHSVPCWHGERRVSNLHVMNADGSGARLLCPDQDHDLHPAVLPSGQILFNRWDYTGISHIYLRELMVMNPDGTGQRALLGSNSWYPNSLYFALPLPNDSSRLVSVLSGYHGPHKMGQLVVLDYSRGSDETDSLVQRISGRGDPIHPEIKDDLVNDDWPKFLHPFPISEKQFLVAAWPAPDRPWGIYLADTFDNLVLIREEPGYALLEPVPLQPRHRPPVIPDRVDPARNDATVYMQDVYAGPGLKGVPRGTAKSLRVISYHFGYAGLAGPDVIGRGGPWEVMRILGTVPVEEDGSAYFSVPANTPLAVQVLDAEGKAVQLMRSWFTAMPAERVSCIGCHESPVSAPPPTTSIATAQPPRTIDEWFGPARGFDFAREVQPVLNAHCVRCHDGSKLAAPDLRPEEQITSYTGLLLSKLAIERMPPVMKAATGGRLKYTPAYDALLPYVRRVGIEDDVSLLAPGRYHADTSPLVQLLKKGHHDVVLDAESWSRLVTWIDLNAPCHGTWGDAFPLPEGIHERRMAMRKQFGGSVIDPERVVPTSIAIPPPNPSDELGSTAPVADNPAPGEACSVPEATVPACDTQSAPHQEQTVDLGSGVTLKLVLIPAGQFTMGEANGPGDERPASHVEIRKSFWLGAFEVSNEQFRQFNPAFDSRYYNKRLARPDDQGLPLNDPRQPAMGLSWQDAMAFCDWLSQRTGRPFTLPTEAQWEWACRAGSTTPLAFGDLDADFSSWANLADRSFGSGLMQNGKPQLSGGVEHLVLEGADLSDRRFDDHAVVTAPVGSFQSNAWGLFDMHGNAAEWTLSAYRSYPYRADDGRNLTAPRRHRVVRGGSFFDPPSRSRSAERLDYPSWQPVFNVGFRVASETEPTPVGK